MGLINDLLKKILRNNELCMVLLSNSAGTHHFIKTLARSFRRSELSEKHSCILLKFFANFISILLLSDFS